MSAPGKPAYSGGSRSSALTALCTTEIVSYGVLYYAFAVLSPAISADTGWSTTAVVAAFSAGNLVGALAGISAGRILQRRGPRLVMTAGSALGTAAVVGIALSPSYGWFLVAWLVAGVAMAGLFYPPAFAALTGWYGPDRVRALTTLTVAAGFASTIFAPLTAELSGHLSWRHTYLVLALLLAAITLPAHALALGLPWSSHRHSDERIAVERTDRVVLMSRPFVLLAVSITLAAFALYAVMVNLVPLLTGRGLSATAAAWALGLGGVGQVAGRLCYRRLAAHFMVRARTSLVISAGAASTLLLAVLRGPAVVFIAAAVAAGAVRGLFTLLEATAVSDRWGTHRYACVNGAFMAPVTAAMAIAPTVGAALAVSVGSYPALFMILAAVAGVSAALAATVTVTGSPAPLQFERAAEVI